MTIPEAYKDTMDWNMIGGLDTDGEAQGLTFVEDRVVVDDGSIEWKTKQYEYTSNLLDYKGLNRSHKAATTAATWYVWKYTWTGTDLTLCEGPVVGVWDDRASLDWA